MFNKSFKYYLLIILTAITLTGCGFKPMDHEHNTRLEKIKIGMSVQQVKHIFPKLKHVSHHGAIQTYTYTENDYRAISFSGVVTRKVTFKFKHGKLSTWSSH